jgi:hypothetical protein
MRLCQPWITSAVAALLRRAHNPTQPSATRTTNTRQGVDALAAVDGRPVNRIYFKLRAVDLGVGALALYMEKKYLGDPPIFLPPTRQRVNTGDKYTKRKMFSVDALLTCWRFAANTARRAHRYR